MRLMFWALPVFVTIGGAVIKIISIVSKDKMERGV